MPNLMSQFRWVLAAALAAVMAVAATNASADIIDDLGNLNVGDTAIFGHSRPAGADYLDEYLFGLNSNSSIGSVVASLQFAPVFGVTNLKVEIFDSLNNSLGSANAVGGVVELAVGGLLAGEYVLAVTYDTTGSLGGAYGGVLAVVPLPPALLLLASALVTLVLFGRLRRRATV